MTRTRPFERIGVITGVAGRRRWSVEEKLRIVAESVTCGLSVSAVAQRHGLRPNPLFKAEAGQGGAFCPPGDGAPSFVPVRLVSEASGCGPVASSARSAAGISGATVENILANGCRLRVAADMADIEASVLHRLVTTLKRHRFGRSSEKRDPDQLALGLEAIEEQIGAVAAAETSAFASSAGRARTPRRKPLPAQLPREERRHEPEVRVSRLWRRAVCHRRGRKRG